MYLIEIQAYPSRFDGDNITSNVCDGHKDLIEISPCGEKKGVVFLFPSCETSSGAKEVDDITFPSRTLSESIIIFTTGTDFKFSIYTGIINKSLKKACKRISKASSFFMDCFDRVHQSVKFAFMSSNETFI